MSKMNELGGRSLQKCSEQNGKKKKELEKLEFYKTASFRVPSKVSVDLPNMFNM